MRETLFKGMDPAVRKARESRSPSALVAILAWVASVGVVCTFAADGASATSFDIIFSCDPTSSCVGSEPIGSFDVDDLDLGVPNAVVDIKRLSVAAFGIDWVYPGTTLGGLGPVLHLDDTAVAYAVQWEAFPTVGEEGALQFFALLDIDAVPQEWFCDLGCVTLSPMAFGTYTIAIAIPEPSAALVFGMGLLAVATSRQAVRR